jgi:hypothetical protein
LGRDFLGINESWSPPPLIPPKRLEISTNQSRPIVDAMAVIGERKS